MNSQELVGNNVIATPGQTLTNPELTLLMHMADGQTVPEICQTMGVNEDLLPFAEGSIRRKLGANTQAHMMAQAFILGVLRPRYLAAIAVGGLISYQAWSTYGPHDSPALPITPALQIDMASDYLGPAASDPNYEALRARRGH